MTLKEHVFAIRNLINKGVGSDDSAYSLRFIAHLLNVARAVLTEQKADKYHYISEQSFQSLCIDLEPATFHNCCSVTDVECKILRSKNPLPKFLNTRWGDFAKVMTLVGEVLSKTSPTMNSYSAYTITNTTPKPGWFIHDNHLYIINNVHLEKALMNSLFDNPVEIAELNCPASNTTTCPAWYDNEYPIDPDLVSPAYRMVLDSIYRTYNLPPQDTNNDAQDNQVTLSV